MVLGLDCGGSKVQALALRGEEAVFEGRGGPANWASERALVEASVRQALQGCPKVEAVCGCFAGLLTRKDKEEAERLLREATGCDRVEARPDYHAAWESAKGSCDVLVIAGTGALVCSDADGEIVKSGGGGVLFGDEGSAASVGRNALQAQVVSALSLPATENFWRRVEKVFGSREPNEVVAALYRSEAPAALFASLAEVVAQDAAAEEDYAAFAVTSTIVALRDEAVAHALRYQQPKLPRVRFGLTGGLWKVHPLFFERFMPFEGEPRVTATKHVVDVDPVRGACMLAARSLA
jgi:N-acetylglucosamine kinase-like BadF-type ATPase